jgi:hypothetical protein
MRFIRIFLALMLTLALPAIADDPDFSLGSAADFAIPESPAFTVLGVTPQDVTRPGTPSAFAASILRAVGDNGELQTGVALDAAPYLALRGRSLTLGMYQKAGNQFLRLKARTKLSLGTTQSGDSVKTDRIAAGLHLTIFDYGDPRLDKVLVECFNGIANPIVDVLVPQVQGSTTQTDLDERKFIACREQSAQRNWNRSSWIVAGAPVWIHTPNVTDGFSSDGGGVWTSISWGFEPWRDSSLGKHAQIIGHWRKRFGEHVTKDGATSDHDKSLYGVRLRLGTARLSGSVEATRSEDDSGGVTSRVDRFLAGIEQTLTSNLSLQLSFGRERVHDGESSPVVRSGFHWKFKTD